MSIRQRGVTPTPCRNQREAENTKRYFWLIAITNLIVFGGFFIYEDDSKKRASSPPLDAANHQTVDDQTTPDIELDDNPPPGSEQGSVSSPPIATLATESWQDIEVKNGDNLSLIFGRAGLGAREVHHFVSGNSNAKLLRNIYPGQTLSFLVEGNELHGLRYTKSKLKTLEFTLAGNQFESETITHSPDVVVKQSHAVITSNLFLAGQKAGLSQNTIMELANIFSGVLDFALDPRRGDSFTVLFEKLYLNGEAIGNGHILAAEYINAGERFQAYRYIDSHSDIGYYNESGVSMRKTFLRAPVDFSRISSNFNPNRLHPVFKTRRPHRGIDYAAATGTPVFASGAGRVITSSFSAANGNYIVIQHGPSYVTKYLHLSKRSVQKGQRVKQKQIIGKVGSTGYATGAHLHYEFLVNGVHRNPRTILDKLPKAKALSKNELSDFKTKTKQISMQLEMISSQYAGDGKGNSNDG